MGVGHGLCSRPVFLNQWHFGGVPPPGWRSPVEIHRSQIVREIDRLAAEPQCLATFDVRPEDGGTLHKLADAPRSRPRGRSADSLHHMKAVGVGRTVNVDHGERAQTPDPHSVDHEYIALVMADGIAVPRRCHLRRMPQGPEKATASGCGPQRRSLWCTNTAASPGQAVSDPVAITG
jgi:hypothetical protein